MNTAQAVQEKPEAKSNKVYKIALTGLFAALSYVVFTFLQFKIYLPGGDATSIHLGNAVCVLGALLLGGFYGGLGGAIGMTIGDLLILSMCLCTKDLCLKALHRSDHRSGSTSHRTYQRNKRQQESIKICDCCSSQRPVI